MSCIKIDGYLHYFDRVLLITWLLKDFGWMTTNVFIGFPFGALSISLHFFLLCFDPRRSYRYYNISLLLWVTGNYIWMSIEFMSTVPSSNVHIGPHVPLGGMSETTQATLINVKTILFLVSSIIQIIMYLGIYGNCIKMPEEENEDMISKNEAYLFCYGNKSYELTKNRPSSSIVTSDSIEQNDIDEINEITQFNFLTGIQNTNTLTLAYLENAYIIFWISKDLFWSWGTGDLTKGEDLAIMYEALAMCFGLLSIFIYLLTAYLYRRNLLRLFDCITTIFWISANYVWMCGEFFLRYNNLTLDDEDEGNDTTTRIISAIFFSLGLLIQFTICIVLGYQKYRSSSSFSSASSLAAGGGKVRNSGSFEMTTIQSPFQYNRLLVSYSPQNGGKRIDDLMEDEEISIVF